jgi:hypothetical protein
MGGPAIYYIWHRSFLKESALRILDCKVNVVRETKLPTDPEVIGRFVAAARLAIERIGLESGCNPQPCLFAGIQRAWLAGDLHRCAARGSRVASWFPQKERL